MNLARFGNIPINYATLTTVLKEYHSPKDKIASLERKQQLIRIKKGLYVVAPKISHNAISHELIANHLYGPSYISLETALSFHGLIPERVYAVQSVTAKRAKQFNTPLGTFNYRTVAEKYFPIGIQQKESESKSIFLIASPEKALCDLIILNSGWRIQSVKAMKVFLEENMRIDLTEKEGWDIKIISECIERGKKKSELKLLLKLLEQYE